MEAVVICFPDRLTATNAEGFYNDSLPVIGENPDIPVVLDAIKMDYISSAGLRSVMRLKKKYKNLGVINVSEDVYSVFEMTGFTEIMSVEKAYRKCSVDGLEIVGRGAKSIVYRYDNETILKVYNGSNSFEDIKMERKLAREAFISGMPTAISYGIVMVGQEYGALYELLDADTIASLIAKNPSKVDKYAILCADIMKQIHTIEVGNMDVPDAKNEIYEYIDGGLLREDPKVAQEFKVMVDGLSNPGTLIHGDFHAGNVMMANGEPMLIDMGRLSYGNPVIELAGVYMFYVAFGEISPDIVEEFMGFSYEVSCVFWKTFIRHYTGDMDEAYIENITKKISLITYVRLLRRAHKNEIKNGGLMSPKEKQEAEYYMDKIKSLMAEVTALEL